MSDMWGTIIAAGVSLAGGLLADENKDEDRKQSREETILELQDNERDRQNRLALQQMQADATLAAARIGLEGTKKRILGDALLNKGKDEGSALLSRFQTTANRPERFGTAATSLAAMLQRR